MERKSNLAYNAGGKVNLKETNRQIATRLLGEWQQGQADSAPSPRPVPEMDYVLGLQKLEVLLEQKVPACMDEFHSIEMRLLEVLEGDQLPESTSTGRPLLAALDRLVQKTGSQQKLQDLCQLDQDVGPPGSDPMYLFRYLGSHLLEADLQDQLFELVEDPTWCHAQHYQLGSHSSYLADLQRACQVARRRGGHGLPLLMHYSLLSSLVQGSGSEVDPKALVAQADAGDLQPALDRAELIRDPNKRIEAELGIAEKAVNRDLSGFAGQILSRAEAAIVQVTSVELQAKAWFDIAAIKAGLGEAKVAENDLTRGLSLLPPLKLYKEHPTEPKAGQQSFRNLSTQGKPPQPNLAGREFYDPSWVERQSTVMNDYWAEETFGKTVAAYCSAVICYFRLGQRKKAAALLAQLKPVLHQSDFSSGAVQGLVDCALKLAGLDQVELSRKAVDAIGHRVDHSDVFQFSKFSLKDVPGEKVTNPFGVPALVDASKVLAKMGKPELAVQLLHKLGGKLDRVKAEELLEVVELTENPVLLAQLARNQMLTENKAARCALVKKIARKGDLAIAQDLADDQPVALAALAATLLSVQNPRGQTILDQVLQRAKGRADNGKRKEAYLLIVKSLAEEGCCDQALTVWRLAQASAKGQTEPKREDKARVAIAACLAQSDRLNEAQAFVEDAPNNQSRIAALSGVAIALIVTGHRSDAVTLFERAIRTADSLRNREEKFDVLEGLLDSLLDAQQFDLAMQVAKKLDRGWVIESVMDEPGLLFKIAKDKLARAVGRPADEDLAIDTAPDNQVKVIQAIAKSGDYRLAHELAVKISNISVQEEMLEEIADAARQAGDLETAFKVIEPLDDDSYILDELQTQAAGSGIVGQETSAGDSFRFAEIIPMFALDVQHAIHGNQDAAERISLYVDTFCELLYDPDDDSRRMGLWGLKAIMQMVAQTNYSAGQRLILDRLRIAKEKAIQAKQLDECERAFQNAALILAGTGHLEQVTAFITELSEPIDQARLIAQSFCYLGFTSGPRVVNDGLQYLNKLKINDTFKQSLQNEMWAASALGQAGRGEITQAWKTAERITRPDIHRAVAKLLANIQAWQDGAASLQAAFQTPDELTALPGLLMSFFVRSLVALGAGEYAWSLVSSPPRQSNNQLRGKRDSPWWWEPFDDQTQQIAEDLGRHGQPAEKGSDLPEQPALVLVQALSATERKQNDPQVPHWLLEVIENELSGSRKLGGLTALANWMALGFRQDPERILDLSMEALNKASGEGLWDVPIYIAGMAPLLFTAGGSGMLNDMSQRMQSIQQRWITKTSSV